MDKPRMALIRTLLKSLFRWIFKKAETNQLAESQTLFDIPLSDLAFNFTSDFLSRIREYCFEKHGIHPNRIIFGLTGDFHDLQESDSHSSDSIETIRIFKDNDDIVAVVYMGTYVVKAEDIS